MIRLSICIPTLNRGHLIAQTLQSILPQLTDATELLVVDGASTDNTEAVVRAVFAGQSNCRYVRLDQKGGVDADYARSVELASGEYCWLMTDDDLVVPGAIARILRALETNPDLLILNATVASENLSEVLIPRKLAAPADRVFPPTAQGELLAFAGELLSFIGSVIIRRSVWLARDYRSYFGTEFVHVGVIFQEPLRSDAIVLAEPLIRIRYGNASWWRRAFEIWMFKWPRLIWSFGHLPDRAKATVCAREPWRSLYELCLFKARGLFTSDTYNRWLRPQSMSVGKRLLTRALALFPNRFFHCLVDRYCKGRPMAKTFLVELRQSPFAMTRRVSGTRHRM
jgi:glycosyltransferase involved in cell wall biosynthesis